MEETNCESNTDTNLGFKFFIWWRKPILRNSAREIKKNLNNQRLRKIPSSSTSETVLEEGILK